MKRPSIILKGVKEYIFLHPISSVQLKSTYFISSVPLFFYYRGAKFCSRTREKVTIDVIQQSILTKRRKKKEKVDLYV